jgi:RecA-family ATPase
MSADWQDDIHFASKLRDAELERPRPVVKGLLNEGETGVLAGRPKMGKSRLIMQLAVSLSRGMKFLGYEVPKKNRVLVLDLENRPAVVQERLNKMSKSDKSDSNVLFYSPRSLAESVVSLEEGKPDGKQKASRNGLEQLRDMVKTIEPNVLIIDTWRLLIGATDENKGEIVLQGLMQLSKLRIDQPSLSIILVHHLRKQTNGAGGASLRTDAHTWVESVL